MKLTDIKKHADDKRNAEIAACEAARKLAELDVHPLVKAGSPRNVRDAYFCGVVFAALADDLDIDDEERKAINRIGISLQLTSEERTELVTSVKTTVCEAVKSGGGQVFGLLEECAQELKSEDDLRLFTAEYVRVSGVKTLKVDDEKKQLTEHLVEHVYSPVGIAFDSRFFNLICRCEMSGEKVQDGDLVSIADILGDDRLRYLVLDKLGDVQNRLTSMRKTLAARARSKKEMARLERVRGAFEAELLKISNDYKDVASMPDGWDDDFRERMAQYETSDIDWVSSVNSRLGALRRIPCCYSKLVGQRETLMRRKLVWKLVGMYWVAVEELDRLHLMKIDDLLQSARQLSTEGFNAKVESFIEEAFKGVVELTS